MEKAILVIEEKIRSSGGNLNVKMKPRAVSETDDLELEKLIDEADRMNRDVDGDDDISGSEDEDGKEGKNGNDGKDDGDESESD
ncbi:hypothetical protein HK405_008737 [Cladochytrium tenue]|nr:hypothetical protein HK405_008737 [Cladochytrium tenue]